MRCYWGRLWSHANWRVEEEVAGKGLPGSQGAAACSCSAGAAHKRSRRPSTAIVFWARPYCQRGLPYPNIVAMNGPAFDVGQAFGRLLARYTVPLRPKKSTVDGPHQAVATRKPDQRAPIGNDPFSGLRPNGANQPHGTLAVSVAPSRSLVDARLHLGQFRSTIIYCPKDRRCRCVIGSG